MINVFKNIKGMASDRYVSVREKKNYLTTNSDT